MKQCVDCSAIEEAMAALSEALEYSRRRFANDGFVTYNHHEAIRLGKRAARLSDAAPVDHSHSMWHVSDCDDTAMMVVESDSFHAIKEHVSERAHEESIFQQSPLELWADDIEWCK